MARIVDDLNPGDIVYEPYSPARYGKILQRLRSPYPDGYPDYEVKWKDGKITRVSCLHVNSYDDLIASTERKLKTHKEAIKKAQAL